MTDTSRTAEAVDLLALTATATRGRVVASVLIDVGAVVLPLALSAAAFALGADAVGGLLVGLAIIAAAFGVAAFARAGRALGGRVAGIRVVEQSSASAPGRLVIADLFGGRLRAFDLRRGRDPLSPALVPFRFAAVSVPRPTRTAARRPAVVALDSGQQLALATALLIGRDPSTSDGAPVFRWTDLSRTLSKSHARLEWDGTALWVTDLGSTNGTAIVADRTTPLVPLRRTPLPPSVTLMLGDRTLTVAVPA